MPYLRRRVGRAKRWLSLIIGCLVCVNGLCVTDSGSAAGGGPAAARARGASGDDLGNRAAFPEAAPAAGEGPAAGGLREPDEATQKRVAAALGKLPLDFVANAGQADERVKFFSRGSGYGLYLTPDEAVMVLTRTAGRREGGRPKGAAPAGTRRKESSVVRMKLLGADGRARVSGQEELPGKSNYFIGNDPKKWRTDVARYRKVRYEAVYPGVDMVYHGDREQLEYDFIVAPHTDPRRIKLKFDGATRIRLDRNGDLLLFSKTGVMRQHRPEVYQDSDGGRVAVEGEYVLGGGGVVSFRLGAYDPARPLVIDPRLSYSTYLGGSGLDEAYAMALDPSNNIYIAGVTDSTDLPLANPFQSVKRDGTNAVGYAEVFASKLDATGQSLVYSTYLGGAGVDRVEDIAVDSAGHLHLTGSTGSADFPVANAYQSTLRAGASDVFLTKLSPAGNSLVYSTFFGGTSPQWLPGNYLEVGRALAIDPAGNAYLTGLTDSTQFPVVQPIKATLTPDPTADPNSPTNDLFLAKFNPAGTPTFSTYLGGNKDDEVYDVVLDAAGNIYLAGSTSADDFHVVNASRFTAAPTHLYNSDAFVMKVAGDGSQILYSTLFGGTSHDSAEALAVDAAQNVYLTGYTFSYDFPVLNALQPTNPNPDVSSNQDVPAFVFKLQSNFSAIVFSTYFGATTDTTRAKAIQLDSANNIYLAGITSATDLPLVDPIYSENQGLADAFLSKLSADGSTLMFSTYLGGSRYDYAFEMLLNADGDIYIAGYTDSDDLPLLNPYQQNLNNLDRRQTYEQDAFVMRLSAVNQLTITGQVSDAYGNGMAGVTISLTGSETKTTQTLSNGRYLLNVEPGGNYTVTASKSPFSFSPASRVFNAMIADQTADFTPNSRNLSGRVADAAGNGLPDATVALSGTHALSVKTDADGLYTISAPSGGTYTITPSKAAFLAVYVFSPATRSVSNLAADQTGLNFTSSVNYVESFYPLADAYVEDGASAGVNFGTAAALKVETDKLTNTGTNRDAYFKFDVSGLSRRVIGAKLRVYASASTTGSVTTAAYGVSSTTWVESGTGGINWSNKPAAGTTAITNSTTTVTGTAYASYDIDVTSYVTSEVAAGRGVFSLALHNPSYSTTYYTLNSREAAANKPQLIVTTGDNNQAPTVTLTAPLAGAQFTAPAGIQLSATAADIDGTVSKVEYYAGTSLVASATAAPFTATWSGVEAGSYQLTAVATDNSGAAGTSAAAAVTVVVPNNAPTVSLTAPAGEVTFPAGSTVNLSAAAADLDGTVSKVEFFTGTTLVGTATASPYNFAWVNVPAGSHTLTAKATDNSGAATTSAAVQITAVWQTGFSPTADAYVSSASASTNFGTAVELQTLAGGRETYLKFDPSAAVAGTITSARLRLYGRLSAATGSNVPVAVYPVSNTAWVESGSGSITWSNKPPAGATALATATVTDNVARWYEWDITAYVQQERGANRLVSLALKNTAASTPYVTFDSKEATLATANRPQLLITTTAPRSALLVTASTTLNSSESAVQTRLQSLGFAVTVKAAGTNNNAVKATDANGKTLVVISSTVTTVNVTNVFRYVAVPVVNWEFDILGHMGMTGTASGTDFGTATGQTQLVISNAAHPLAAGLGGTVSVAGAAGSFTWGKPNANAVKAATLTGDATKAAVFGYEVGATMPGLFAPARRVALFLTDTTAAGLNASGWSLFEAAVKWAAAPRVAPAITGLTPTAGTYGTAVTIAGYNFGDTQGDGSVTFNGVAASVSGWGGTAVLVSVPSGAATGPAVVTVGGLASNGVTFTVNAPAADTDGDGLPDAWEMQHFGNLAQNAGGDPDGDGLTNLQEYQQGRNPTKPAQPDDGTGVNLKVHTPLAPPGQ
jgi:hypothetical protein